VTESTADSDSDNRHATATLVPCLTNSRTSQTHDTPRVHATTNVAYRAQGASTRHGHIERRRTRLQNDPPRGPPGQCGGARAAPHVRAHSTLMTRLPHARTPHNGRRVRVWNISMLEPCAASAHMPQAQHTVHGAPTSHDHCMGIQQVERVQHGHAGPESRSHALTDGRLQRLRQIFLGRDNWVSSHGVVGIKLLATKSSKSRARREASGCTLERPTQATAAAMASTVAR